MLSNGCWTWAVFLNLAFGWGHLTRVRLIVVEKKIHVPLLVWAHRHLPHYSLFSPSQYLHQSIHTFLCLDPQCCTLACPALQTRPFLGWLVIGTRWEFGTTFNLDLAQSFLKINTKPKVHKWYQASVIKTIYTNLHFPFYYEDRENIPLFTACVLVILGVCVCVCVHITMNWQCIYTHTCIYVFHIIYVQYIICVHLYVCISMLKFK